MAPLATSGIVMMIGGVLMLIFGLLSILLLLRYRKALKAAAQEARSTWAAETAALSAAPATA